MQSTTRPPDAARHPSQQTHHGVTLDDDYAWLRDANWRAAMQDPGQLDADIRAYLEAENAYTDAHMAGSSALRETLVAEMRGRIAEADASVPAPDGDWAYYLRFREAGQHPIFCRRPRQARDEADEQVLLDGDAQAEGQSYFSLGGVAHSPCHRYLAFGCDSNGSETYALSVREIESGGDIQPPIDHTTGNLLWSADSRTLFYTTLDDNHRPCRVWRLALGEPQENAELVYEEPDPGFFVSVSSTQSQRFVLINAHDHETSELRFIDAASPWQAPALIAPRRTGEEYSVEDDGDDFVILTNADGARDFKLMRAPVAQPGRDYWRELVAHEPRRLILDFVEYAGHRVRMENVDALPRIVITDKQSGDEHVIGFDAEAYSLALAPGLEYDTATLRFVYAAPATPDETWDYDMARHTRVLRKRRIVPSGFDASRYRVERRFAAAGDGERIPITLLYAADLELDGTAPCLLQGYGAYGISQAAAFGTSRLSLVDRGFVYAIAHVRGGQERGHDWYADGKLAHKPNTFSDFIAVAEYLAETGYSARGRIAPHGGSAGGMLVGAVLNQRPDLFGAAIADVPFVDVLNTMLDETLPLTPPEWPEWGNPRDDKAAFDTIRGYCPYQNVTAQAYPPILAIAGVSDPRVTYWEPAKWVAKLRATKTDANRLLLKTHMAAGHGGISGRLAALEETALIYAFLIEELGRAESA